VAHADKILSLLCNPFHRTLRAHDRLRSIYPDTRRARLVARGMALTSAHPLTWDQVSMMLAAEEKASR
jgi:hypothetical protein